MPSTWVRFLIVISRSAGRHGAIVKPQLPITAVVTPSAGEGDSVGSQVICASKWVWLSMMPGISARPSAATVRAASTSSRGPTRDDAAAVDGDVASARLAAAAVDDERVAKDEVDHAVFRRGAANSDSISRRILYAGVEVSIATSAHTGSGPSSPAARP